MNKIFSKDLIQLNIKSSTKNECIEELSSLLYQQGKITDVKKYVADVHKREEEFSTELENGAAIPHAKSIHVKSPSVAIGISKKGITFGNDETKKTHLIFLIAMPENSDNTHIHTLSTITSKLLDENDVTKMINSKSIDELIYLLEDDANEEVSVTNNKFLIGVTGCPVGVAHTYLAAKSLTKAANEMGYSIKVETNGSIGVENSPTNYEIDRADGIIVSCDKEVYMDRFNGKRVVVTGVKSAIDKPKELINKALDPSTPLYTSKNTSKKRSNEEDKGKGTFYKALMNGVSFMIPFVVIGGLMIAVSLALGGEPTPGGLVIPEGSIWNKVLSIGDIGFKLMIPILAGYIAYAIGDRPALAPGMIGGWIANNGSFYGADAGAGFIGAIAAGLLVGYFVLYFKKIKFPKAIEALVPIMIIPILGSLFIGFIFIFIIGAPISSLMSWLFDTLKNMSSGSMIILGLVIGLMQGFDMGGPFGKVAFMFSVGLIAEGQYQFMGAQAVAIPVAPLGMALATFLDRKKMFFKEEERANGKAALAMGLVGISEGAIPFAASDPLAIIPANMIGSAVACILGFLFGITNTVAHGGPIVLLLGVVNKPFMGLLAMVIGTIVTALLTLTIKKFRLNKKTTKAK
ncbi:fructose-specific PTS transporter subunit EIIC [Clostridium sp. 1001275B_160808_H3]|uniref:PTS fructose transporter subunit IIABC n=1 Tax=Clostridium sp. 1001275B_160808_H3 TaxID=2787110 RepID=UPI0018977297|nr:fructose-specific PTS transporter subunit EIIC [Clostridium sp. 1001275B_160808_H3]